MTQKFMLNRRRLLGLGAASASTLMLAGCDQFDFLSDGNNGVREVLTKANDVTYRVQRLLVGQQALAPEYTEADIRQGQRPNGSTDPQSAPYVSRWRRLLPRSRLLVVEGGAHGVASDGCLPAVVARFLERGSADGLDTACAGRPIVPSFQLR